MKLPLPIRTLKGAKILYIVTLSAALCLVMGLSHGAGAVAEQSAQTQQQAASSQKNADAKKSEKSVANNIAKDVADKKDQTLKSTPSDNAKENSDLSGDNDARVSQGVSELGDDARLKEGVTSSDLQAQEAHALVDKLKEIDTQESPILVELFTSAKCVFCPPADAILETLDNEYPEIIALGCHIDYFGGDEGGLATPICSKRQSYYLETLKVGANYTPQMIIQGHYDLKGYDLGDISAAIKDTKSAPAARINIEQAQKAGRFTLYMPENVALPAGDEYELQIVKFLKPYQSDSQGRSVTRTDVKTEPQKMARRYVNAVSDTQALGLINDKTPATMVITVPQKENDKGFVILIQGKKSGRIIALGRYIYGDK
jgi:cell division protein FtsB